mgnify:CR=1 FL=1
MSAAPAARTRITSMLGCRYPVILPGMSWISTPELVAAVSNAGESPQCQINMCVSHDDRLISNVRRLTLNFF